MWKEWCGNCLILSINTTHSSSTRDVSTDHDQIKALLRIYVSVYPDEEQWALSVVSISDSQVCLLLSTIIHYKKEGGTQLPRGHSPSLCSHDRDSMERTDIAHPHRLFILLPYSMEVFSQQWERCREDTGTPSEYLGAGHDPFLWQRLSQQGSPPRLGGVSNVCCKRGTLYHIISYCIVLYHIISPLECMFIWSYICMLITSPFWFSCVC